MVSIIVPAVAASGNRATAATPAIHPIPAWAIALLIYFFHIRHKPNTK